MMKAEQFAAADRAAVTAFMSFRPASGPAAEHCVSPKKVTE
jgi:hypothetical protein